MKKIIATAFVVFIFLQINAQGVNQLWGLSKRDGLLPLKHLFSWDSATNNITNRKTFFASVNGSARSNLALYNGVLYGVTGNYIFEWNPQFPSLPAEAKVLINGEPNGNLIPWNDKIYGLTNTGGSADSGFLFEWDPASLTAVEKIAFDFTTGSKPLGGLVLLNDKFYGMTAQGGDYNMGVVFEWDPGTGNYTKKFDFDGSNGASPNGNLTWIGSLFYGVTDSGGVNNAGVLFSWDPATNNYNKKVDFAVEDGKNPCGTLVATSDRLYGMTTNGGANGLGVIFLWNTSAEAFSKLVDLNSTEGGNPHGSMTLYDAKLYAGTTQGMLEYDTITNSYLNKYEIGGSGNNVFNHPTLSGSKLYSASFESIAEIDLTTNTKRDYFTFFNSYWGNPPSGPTGLEANGKIYGLTDDGGPKREGMIFKYDVADYNNPYQGVGFFDMWSSGAFPFGRAFGGMTSYGGQWAGGTFFDGFNAEDNSINIGGTFNDQYDPISNPSSGKVNQWGFMMGSKLLVDPGTGDGWVTAFDLGHGTGEPDLFGYQGNIVGVTDVGGGANNMGFIFHYTVPYDWFSEPGILENKVDFNGTNGASPNGTFTPLHGKFYGTTRLGGANNQGTLYEWDPGTNTLITLVHFDGSTTGQVTSPLIEMNGKLYGMRGGGLNNKGMIFEFDPSNNQFTNKGIFDGTTNGQNTSERLVVAPAGIARSAPGRCVGFPSVTIDATNNSKWVPIVDSRGDVLAEIKANGNNLGLLTIQSYVNAGPVRADGQGNLYLDRNVTITPAQQPAEGNPVDVRLYIPQSEFDALLNTGNAAIDNINDVAIFKGSEHCDNQVQNAAPLPTTAEAYPHGYILTTSVPSFSSFYFASRTFAVLPLQLLSFSATEKNGNAELNWTTTNEYNVWGFEVERSIDKINFTAMGTLAAYNTPGNHKYRFTDANIQSHGVLTLYYRIKIKDKDGSLSYSATIALQLNAAETIVQFYPNPVSNRGSLVINADQSQQVQWRIFNNSGKTISKSSFQIQKGVISLPIEVTHLPRGIYYIDVKGKNFSKLLRFVRQ